MPVAGSAGPVRDWKAVCNRHRRWSAGGTGKMILGALRAGCDQGAPEWAVAVDATAVRDDSLAFRPLTGRLAIGRPGGGRPRTRAGRVLGDRAACRNRNTVERAFSQVRRHRAVVTRFGKRDFVWRGTIDVASIRIWLRHPVHDRKDTL